MLAEIQKSAYRSSTNSGANCFDSNGVNHEIGNQRPQMNHRPPQGRLVDPEVPNSAMTVAALPSHSRLNRHFPRNKPPNLWNHHSVHHENTCARAVRQVGCNVTSKECDTIFLPGNKLSTINI